MQLSNDPRIVFTPAEVLVDGVTEFEAGLELAIELPPLELDVLEVVVVEALK